MKKKVGIMVIASIGFILLCNIIAGAGIALSERMTTQELANNEETYITRYEWIGMLCQQVGIDTYESKVPYFEDVQENNIYFPCVQGALEWEILEQTPYFEGEKAATGEFVALTTMKAIGQYKIQMGEETKDELTDDRYIELATSSGLIKTDKLANILSKKECEQVLQNFYDLYFKTYLKDNYFEVKFKEVVIEVPLDVLIQHNEDYSEIVLQENDFEPPSQGTVLILEEENTGLKMARKVVAVDGNGKYTLEEVELSEVVETLIVSDITPITIENIINYYGLEADTSASVSKKATTQKAAYKATALGVGQMENAGFTIELSTTEAEDFNTLCVKVTDNNTGISYELPTKIAVGIEDVYSAEIAVTDIIVSTQLDYSASAGVNYADVTAEGNATITGSIELPLGEEIKIPLFKTPVPLGNGFVGVDIEFYLSISAEGSISLEAEIPMQASVRYEKGKGLGNIEHAIDVKEPIMQINCEGNCTLCLEPALVILKCVEVLDVQIEEGIVASAELTQYPTAQVCTDISLAFPVITISVCNNDDKETLVGLLGWSAEWELVEAEDAKVQIGLHHEILPNGTMQFVEECTYKETSLESEKPEENTTSDSFQEVVALEIELNHTWFSKNALVNCVTGYVYSFAYPDNWQITSEVVPTIQYGRGENSSPLYEGVTLTNSRGVEIQYANVTGIDFFEDTYYTVNVTEVGDSLLETPPSDGILDGVYMPRYIVAKIEVMEKLTEDASFGNQPIENTYYAVVPSDFLRYQERARGCGYEGLTLMYFSYTYHNKEDVNDLSDGYRGGTTFFAKAPDGRFSEQEEREVIAILGSFLEGVYEEDWELYDELSGEYYEAYEEFFKELNGR